MDIADASGADAAGLDHPLDALLGYHLRRASAMSLAGLGRSLDEIALKPTEASVLLLIGANPGITQSEIGRLLAIKRANMTPIAAMLTERGLIDRTRPDRRSQGLCLNHRGRALADEARRRMEAHEATLLPDFPDGERAALIDLLRRIWSPREVAAGSPGRRVAA